MKVLVTGNQGYIGTVLTKTLQDNGFSVVGMDTGLFKECVIGKIKNECPTIPVDIRNAKPEHFEGVDAVVHLAAISNDPLGNVNSSITLEVNYEGAMNVARAAKKAGVERFVFASSCSLYGLQGDEILDENAAFNPVTPYGESKVKAEAGLSELADDSFCPVFMRNGTLFGFSPRLRGDLAVNNLTGYAHTINKILLNSDGKAWRPFVHIDDVCESIIAAIKAPREVVFNEAFNVANDDLNVQVMDIVNRIREIVPNCEAAFGEGSGADKRNYKVSGEKIATKLGFKPTRTIDDGIHDVYSAYKQFGLSLEQLEGPILVRLKQLQYLIENELIDENFMPTLDPAGLSEPRTDSVFLECRSCGSAKLSTVVDYGNVPLGSSLLNQMQVDDPTFVEKTYPLRAVVCEDCTLMQLDFEVNSEALFVENYHYRASYSDAILQHAKELSTSLVKQYELNKDDLVLEIGSNDGYFLRWINDGSVRTLGIDPSPGSVENASKLDVKTIQDFFNSKSADAIVNEHGKAKLIFLSNVLSHVRDTPSVLEGINKTLSDDGTLVIENPWVKDLIDENQFDMIYHEHACYFSCHSLEAMLNSQGLYLNDAQYVSDLHGGMLVWHASRTPGRSESLNKYFEQEVQEKINTIDYYLAFGKRVLDVKDQIGRVVRDVIDNGGTLAAYGAVAKGVTLLQALSLTNEDIAFTVDRNPDKIGKFLPGSRIPICHVDELIGTYPDVVLLLAWNYKNEIAQQQQEYLRRGGSFLVPVPEIEFIGNQKFSLIGQASKSKETQKVS